MWAATGSSNSRIVLNAKFQKRKEKEARQKDISPTEEALSSTITYKHHIAKLKVPKLLL